MRRVLLACLLSAGCGGASTGAPEKPAASEGTREPQPTAESLASLRIDPSLSMIPLEVHPELERSPEIAFVLFTEAPERALAMVKAYHPEAEGRDDGLTVTPHRNDRARLEPPSPRHREPSFVIDFDEPSVEAVAARVQSEFGDHPSPNELRHFTRAHFDRIQYGGFDIASLVSITRRGDCTEHAVLLAALARRFGMAARVVFGIVALVGQAPYAFHHAWTEIHHEGEWRTFDAALPTASTRGYLPLAELTNEGPGFAIALPMTNLRIAVTRIRLEPSP